MTITLYTADNLQRLSLLAAYDLLKARGFFHVFLSFTDPRTGCLVQDYFCFYPKPQPSYAGGGVIADHAGLTLRIPYDLSWYAEHQQPGLMRGPELKYEITILKKGEYVRVPFKLEVIPNIRLFDHEEHRAKDILSA